MFMPETVAYHRNTQAVHVPASNAKTLKSAKLLTWKVGIKIRPMPFCVFCIIVIITIVVC